MQYRVLVALVVFIGSYLPLSLILLAQDYDFSYLSKPLCLKFWASTCTLPFKNPGFAIGIFLACIVCLLVTVLSLAVLQPKQEIVIRDARHVPADLMNYTLPYVVSFMSIDYQEPSKFVGFLIFLGWMFWITYRSGQIVLNPVLIVLGWRLYDTSYNYAGSANFSSSYVLAKGEVAAGKRYRQAPVHDILVIQDVREAT